MYFNLKCERKVGGETENRKLKTKAEAKVVAAAEPETETESFTPGLAALRIRSVERCATECSTFVEGCSSIMCIKYA